MVLEGRDALDTFRGNLWRMTFHGPGPFLLHVSFNRGIFFRQINVSSANLSFPFPSSSFETLSQCRGISVWLAAISTLLSNEVEMRDAPVSSERAWNVPALVFVPGMCPLPRKALPHPSLQIQVL